MQCGYDGDGFTCTGCPDPPGSLENGQGPEFTIANPQAPYAIGTEATYTCNDGYEITPPGGIRVCSGPNLMWSPSTLLCTDINECESDPSPCAFNGICTNTPGSIDCACKGCAVGDGFTRTVILDLVFVVDGSDSIGSQSFNKIRTWLKSFIASMDLGFSKMEIGIVVYSVSQSNPMNLGQTNDKTVINGIIDTMNYPGGGTYTANALTYTINSQFPGRPNAIKKILLLTDGEASDSGDLPAVATLAISSGVDIFGFAVGPNANTQELATIANGMSNIAIEQDYDQLSFAMDAIFRFLNDC